MILGVDSVCKGVGNWEVEVVGLGESVGLVKLCGEWG